MFSLCPRLMACLSISLSLSTGKHIDCHQQDLLPFHCPLSPNTSLTMGHEILHPQLPPPGTTSLIYHPSQRMTPCMHAGKLPVTASGQRVLRAPRPHSTRTLVPDIHEPRACGRAPYVGGQQPDQLLHLQHSGGGPLLRHTCVCQQSSLEQVGSNSADHAHWR